MSIHIQALGTYLSNYLSQRKQKRADIARRRLYINQIVESVIDDIDPRLHSIMGYKKVIFPCVERVLSYAEEVCSRLPGPIEFTKAAHSTNSTVRTLFTNHQTMAEVFSQCPAVQEFFENNPTADCTYLVLGMKMSEKTSFGMQQHGSMIIKDVMQTNVNFDDYRITNPSLDEASLRFNLRERALHECVAQTIKKLMATKTYNQKLEEDEVKLKMQLNMLKNQEEGLGPLMQADDNLLQRTQDIKTKLKKIENKHSEISKDLGTLNGLLKKAASLLKQPAKLIDVTTVSFCVDHFNQIIKDNKKNDEHRINLAQITFSENEKRVGILAIFPRKELVTRKPKPVFF